MRFRPCHLVLLLSLAGAPSALAQQTKPKTKPTTTNNVGVLGAGPATPAPQPAPVPAPAPAAPPPSAPGQPAPQRKKAVNPQAPVEQGPSPQHFTDPYRQWGNGRRGQRQDVTGTVVGGPGAGLIQTGVSMDVQVGAGGSVPPSAKAVAEEEERQGGGNATLSLSGDQLVGLMGDPVYGQSGREDAARELLDGGLDAVPALVGHLGDKRIYTEVPGDNGPVRVTVGQACDTMLYALVTPRYTSAHAPRNSVTPTRYFKVEDWRAFWQARQGRKLADVRAELRAAVDQYWQSGGTVQTVR